MAAGSGARPLRARRLGRGRPPLGKRQRKAVAQAVDTAEEFTGLQICIYLGSVEEDTRAAAEAMFTAAGLDTKPAVLLLVAPDQRRVEIVTAPHITERLTDEACSRCIAVMTPRFASGDLAGGLVAGLRRLSQEAGPGTAGEGTEELPDVLGE